MFSLWKLGTKTTSVSVPISLKSEKVNSVLLTKSRRWAEACGHPTCAGETLAFLENGSKKTGLGAYNFNAIVCFPQLFLLFPFWRLPWFYRAWENPARCKSSKDQWDAGLVEKSFLCVGRNRWVTLCDWSEVGRRGTFQTKSLHTAVACGYAELERPSWTISWNPNHRMGQLGEKWQRSLCSCFCWTLVELSEKEGWDLHQQGSFNNSDNKCIV